MAIKYTANVIRQIKSGATTYDLQDATLKPFVEQLLSDVASIKGVYTEEQANAHNATLDGAISTETTLTAAQAETLNGLSGVSSTTYAEGQTPTADDANLYNATLTDAVEAGDPRDDDNTTSVKSLSEDLTALEGRVTTVEGEVDTLQSDVDTLEATVEEHARVTAASLTELDSRVDAIEDVNVTTEKMAAWDAKYNKPSTGIPASDLESAVQTSLGKADTSVQTVAVAGGTNNGTIKLTVNGTATDNIAVTGLGSAAYTDSSAYATAAQGDLADSAVQSVAEGATNGTIAVDGTDVAVHGLGSAAYTNSTAYATAAQGAKADTAVQSSEKGVANGVATLDNNGKVPAAQLPSYVDDVIEGYFYEGKFYKEVEHTTEITGESDKIYIDLTNNSNKTYRYSGSAFAEIIASPGTTDNIVEGSTNLYYTDARADARVTAGIQALDAEITSTDGTNVQVKVTEVDGKITAVNVTTDNTVNSTNVTNAITTAIQALDATPSQAAGADGLALSLTQVDGVVTGISGSIAANTYDAHGAAAAVLGASTDTVDANTVYGAKAAAAAAQTAAQTYTDTKVGALPQGYNDVKSYVDAKTTTSVTNGVLTL